MGYTLQETRPDDGPLKTNASCGLRRRFDEGPPSSEVSPQISRLYEPEPGVRTTLRDDDLYVTKFYAGAAKATVVERDSILSLDEAQRNT